MTSIVFSMDRAIQLEGFLQSYRDHVRPCGPVYVPYLASTDRHQQAYHDVFQRHDFTIPWSQRPFKSNLLDLLPSQGTVIFYVDDQVFIRDWVMVEQVGLSLRMAPHLTYCYPVAVDQPLPPLQHEPDGLWSWRWADGQWDWTYPLSIDGHIFDLAELRPWLASVAFSTPNTMEAALQRFRPEFLTRRGYCYSEAKVVNIPWTRVQTDYDNRYAGLDAEWLLEQWETGSRLDVAAFYGVTNTSAHQVFPLQMVPR